MNRERFSNVAPTQVLSEAISKLVAAPGSSAKQQQVAYPFVPSQRFRGAKRGYFFSHGDRGVGYYRDPSHRGTAAQVEDFPWYSGPISHLADGSTEGGEEQQHTKPAAVDAEELLRQAEEQAGADEIQSLDAKALKRLILAFDRKLKENMELRMKYGDQPEKFMDSEVDLDEHVKSLMQAAGSPELYPVLVDSNCIPQLLSLLTHENADIAADVIELFMELTDADAIEDSEEEAGALVDAMLAHNALELLVHRLTTLDERQEDQAKTAFNALSVFENMNEVRQSVAGQLVEKTSALKWLLGRIRIREFDSNKQYAASLLAILVQGNEPNQRALAEVNGIDVVLQSIAPYKNKDPQTPEEEEFLEDCFNVLCSSLMLPANKAAFVKAEGVELMVLMMRQKRLSRFGAIKTLDFATTRNGPCCERFVDHTGLKLLFAVFMGKAKVKGPKSEKDVESEVEERLVSIVSNLLQNLTKGSRRERVAAKFVENGMEKLDRLCEIYFRYDKKLAEAEDRLASLSEELELGEDEVLLERLDAGLYTVQQCSLVMGHLWATEDAGLRKRIVMLLHQKGQTLENVRQHLRELYRSIGSEGSSEEGERQKRRIGRVLLAMGVDVEAEAAAHQPPPEEEIPPPPPEAPESTEQNGHKSTAVQDDDVDMEVDEEPTDPTHAEKERDRDRRRQDDRRRADGERESSRAAAGEGRKEGSREDEEQGQLPERSGKGGRGQDGQQEKEREKEKERDRDRDRHREREADAEREHRERDSRDKREREKDRGRERGKERDSERRDRDKDKQRSRGERDGKGRREGEKPEHREEERGLERRRGDERSKRRRRDKSGSRSP